MINQERVSKMARISIMESGKNARYLRIGRYRLSEYMVIQMIISFISGTLCFAAMVILFLMCQWDNLNDMLARTELKTMVERGVFLYILFMVLYLILSAVIALKKYRYSVQIMSAYMDEVDDLEAEYERLDEQTSADTDDEKYDGMGGNINDGSDS